VVFKYQRAEVQLPQIGIKPNFSMRASFAVLEALGQRCFIDFGYENAEAKAVALPEASMRKVFGL
jgi:hypothetical protein